MNNFNTERNTMPSSPDLFEEPIRRSYVRKGIHAYGYRNGTINIVGEKYIGYSMTEAIRRWRNKH
jgi:hypothetical protein